MNDKELADRLRHIAYGPTLTMEARRELHGVADELDPPKPEPGTKIWVRFDSHELDEWELGEVTQSGVLLFGVSVANSPKWEEVEELKPAHILGPRQVAFDVPPVDEWPTRASSIKFVYETEYIGAGYISTAITRAEAERMEEHDD